VFLQGIEYLSGGFQLSCINYLQGFPIQPANAPVAVAPGHACTMCEFFCCGTPGAAQADFLFNCFKPFQQQFGFFQLPVGSLQETMRFFQEPILFHFRLINVKHSAKVSIGIESELIVERSTVLTFKKTAILESLASMSDAVTDYKNLQFIRNLLLDQNL
jgi:hypothetical protein